VLSRENTYCKIKMSVDTAADINLIKSKYYRNNVPGIELAPMVENRALFIIENKESQVHYSYYGIELGEHFSICYTVNFNAI
jgi:hypothetical protein